MVLPVRRRGQGSLEQAIWAAEKGWAVLAVNLGDKIPREKWKSLGYRSPDELRRSWPEGLSDVAIICGPSDLVVVDVDVPLGEETVTELFDGHDIPDTMEMRTPSGGRHYIFKCGGEKFVKHPWGPGLDIQGWGGIFILTGPGREIVNAIEPEYIPEWLAKRIHARENKGTNPAVERNRDSMSDREYWLRHGVPLGSQNTALASMTMWAANLHMSKADSWAIWRNVMMLPGTEHKDGWRIEREQEKHDGSFDSAVEQKKEEKQGREAEGAGWDVQDLSDLDEDYAPLGEIGPDGIIYESGVYWLYGNSGDGKTVVAYYIAIQRARAGMVTAILEDEMGPKMTKMMLLSLGATEEDMSMISYLTWNGGDTPNLLNSGRALTEFLAEIEADFVIVDCMNAYLSAADLSDNYSNDIRKLLQSAIYPSRDERRAILIIDHKGHSKENVRVRGSSDKMPGCDMMIGLECTETFKQDKSGQVMLTCDKDRNAKAKGMVLQMDMIVEGRNIRPQVTEWFDMNDIQPQKKPENGADLVYDALENAGEEGLTNTEIARITGLTTGQVSGYLSRGASKGTYEKVSGQWYIA